LTLAYGAALIDQMLVEPRAWNRDPLPLWAKEAGGEMWRKWVKNRIAGCDRRARAWARGTSAPVPKTEEWGRAIWNALKHSKGRAHYSHLPLSLLGEPTDWNWPSVDHLSGVDKSVVVIEVRLVNDMKTIMNDKEFRAMVGHLADTQNIPSRKLSKTWKCRRSFKKSEKPTQEPPLPR
jgi:hypothetical protein